MFGFFAFNGGSQAHINKPSDGWVQERQCELYALSKHLQEVAQAIINTMLSGACAALIVLVVHKFRPGSSKKWSLLLTINALLAGDTEAKESNNNANNRPSSSMCRLRRRGTMGSVYYRPWCRSQLLRTVDSYSNDPSRRSARRFSRCVSFVLKSTFTNCQVHFGGGCWGAMSIPFLMRDGIFYGGDADGIGKAFMVRHISMRNVKREITHSVSYGTLLVVSRSSYGLSLAAWHCSWR